MGSLNADMLCVGDVLESSAGLKLQITCPRLCCFRVDHRYPAIPPIAHSGTPGTVRQYASATARAGFFCKVLVPSTVAEGDTVRVNESPHPSYPLSYLADIVYGTSPMSVNLTGMDRQLIELCSMPELCFFEWRDRLVDYRAHLMNDHPIAQPDTMGHPVSYQEGLDLIAGEWCMLGSADNHAIHERAAREGVDHLRKQVGNVVTLRLEGDVVHSDKLCLEKKHIYGKLRNDRGHFAIEIDLGGFPAFPRYAFMTRIGISDPELFLMLSSGGKWRKIPNDV